MGFRYRSLTPAGVATAGRCPDCGENSDGDFDVKRGEGRYQLWAVCSACKTAWQIGGGTHPTTEKSERDLAANAALIGDYQVVDPLPPEEADTE
jgi:hypothetical protein